MEINVFDIYLILMLNENVLIYIEEIAYRWKEKPRDFVL